MRVRFKDCVDRGSGRLRAHAVVASAAVAIAIGGCSPANLEFVALPGLPLAVVASSKQPDLQMSVTGGKASGDHGLEGGFTGDVRLVGGGGGEGIGPLALLRIEAGQYGRDREMGLVDSELGIGAAAPHLHFGLLTGWAYGGFPQNAQNVPIRALAMVNGERVAFRASAYLAWRFSTHGEVPAATDTFGPWNSWGAELNASFGKAQAGGLCVGLSWDRQDDISILALRVGVAEWGGAR